jgi:hypothetical protein
MVKRPEWVEERTAETPAICTVPKKMPYTRDISLQHTEKKRKFDA